MKLSTLIDRLKDIRYGLASKGADPHVFAWDAETEHFERVTGIVFGPERIELQTDDAD